MPCQNGGSVRESRVRWAPAQTMSRSQQHLRSMGSAKSSRHGPSCCRVDFLPVHEPGHRVGAKRAPKEQDVGLGPAAHQASGAVGVAAPRGLRADMRAISFFEIASMHALAAAQEAARGWEGQRRAAAGTGSCGEQDHLWMQ